MSSASEKNGKSEDAGCAKTSERSERGRMAVSSVSSMSTMCGVGEKNGRMERNEKKAGARSPEREDCEVERIQRYSQGSCTGARRPRRAPGRIEWDDPGIYQDEIRIHPDHGN